MICGVKYCGGCNPRYNRTEFLVKLKKAYSGIEFAYVKPGVVYDHLIVINGCLSRCADITQIQVSGDTYKIADENQLDELVTQLRLK